MAASVNYLKNPGFEDGFKGWKTKGHVFFETMHPITGLCSAGLTGKASISQRYDVPGLRILYVGAKMRNDGDSGVLRLTCFDAGNRVVLDLTAKPDAKGNAGIYTKTQAHTAYVVVSVEHSGDNAVAVDEMVLNDDDRNRVEHSPLGSITDWMRPIWSGNQVLEDSVLLLSRSGGAPSGKLLFTPTRVLRLTDSSRGVEFTEGKDFVVHGREIEAVAGSKVPTMKDSEFASGEFPWTDLAGRHVFVTYDHDDKWEGPLAEPCANLLPHTMEKLRAKEPMTVVALGDSITLGINVSGYRNVPPYEPPWPSLFCLELGRVYGHHRIKLYNTALGGMTSEWGKEMAPWTVAPLEPDLVLIAFGMNDFWSLTPAQFKANISSTMAAVRRTNPRVEFVLVASIKFNPDYTHDPTYVGHLADYAGELKSLVRPGVALLDMTAISDALYKAKSAADLQTDPMHPDDFLSRWYAQSLVRMVGK